MDIILLLFIINLLNPSYAVPFIRVLEITKLIYYATSGSWSIIETLQRYPLTQYEIENKLLFKMSTLSHKVDFIIDRLDMYERTTLDKLNSIESEIRYEFQMNSILNNVIDIEASYKLFNRYANKTVSGTIEKYTMKNFAEEVVSHSENSVYSKFLKLNILILGNEPGQLIARKGLFELISKHLALKPTLCLSTQSTSQLLSSVFTVVLLSQFKAFIMIQYSWMLLRVYGEGNFEKEASILNETFLEQIRNQSDALSKSLEESSNSFWKCDPHIHVKEKTYTQITNFLQGYIVNEVDINAGGHCWQNCAYYTYTKQYDCYQDLFCATQPKCNGTLVGCRYHDSDMWVCHSPANKNRLYDYIQFENSDVYGKETNCIASSRASSWWRWLFWHCSYCYCYCDDDTNSERYFNLRAVVSDIANNKIVTGLRFIKVNKVIHLQIQEGLLIDGAVINASTVLWRPVNSFNISDSNVKPDVDYHTLTWDYRAVDLDDLVVPKNYVVTGVKFGRLGGHLNLEVRATLFNHTTGNLIDPLKNSYWISNHNTDGNLIRPRTELKLSRPDVPVKYNDDGQPVNSNSAIDSRSDQFISFQNSDDEFDAAQTTVPFIDTQEVAPEPPVPLVGIGLYHKGRKYSGGFIAPKVFTFNNVENLMNFNKNLREMSEKTPIFAM